MANDQLSWENLFNALPAPDVKLDVNADSMTAVPQPTTLQKSPEPKPVETDSKLSTKNWGKLNFPGSPARDEAASRFVKPAPKAQLESQPLAKVEPPNPIKAEVKAEQKGTAKTGSFKKPASSLADFFESVEEDSEEEQANDEPNVLTVSELNKSIKGLLEGRFPTVWLKAEISNFKAHTSGHYYFALKDAKCQISAVMFRGFNSQLKFRPEDGMEVLVRGKITVFEPRGNYQIFCEVMEPVGAGALQKAYEQLKAKLQKEGLFDQARKRPLPTLPKHIAIVTSPTGAAIRDMLNVLARRFKGAKITLIPCRVQGEQAKSEIVQAIQLGNKLSDVDVMIVGRGGGSIEDLWAFNEEIVARAIAASRVPIISAVGHEVDVTIADFVADLRAPTPSAAAELVVKNAGDLASKIQLEERRLKQAIKRSLEQERRQIENLAKRLVDPQRSLQDASIRCDELLQRLETVTLRGFTDRRMHLQLLREKLGTPQQRLDREWQAMKTLQLRMRTGLKNTFLRKREGLGKAAALLDSLSPLKVVERGYSLISVEDELIKDSGQLKVGSQITIQFARGRAKAEIKEVTKE